MLLPKYAWSYLLPMLTCGICGYRGVIWGVKNAVFELETSSLYYEFECPECDSLDIIINLSSENDEPSSAR